MRLMAVLVALALLVIGAMSASARTLRGDGEVVIAVTVDASGKVLQAEIVSEKPSGKGLGKIARKSVMSYEFGEVKAGTYNVTIKFKDGQQLD